MDEEYICAAKIIDGLFLGDKASSQDLEFLESNKITHIINTASTEVSNEWASHGITYLSYPFQDTETQIIFSATNDAFAQSYQFIDKTVDSGESVLVHSVKGESRSVSIVLSYLMFRYKWALSKCIEFLNTRKPGCNTQPNFLLQLVKFENTLSQFTVFSKSWDLTSDPDEVLLRNTFLNAKPGDFVKYSISKTRRKRKIRWVDGYVDNKRIQSASTRRIARSSPIHPRPEAKITPLKSCLKVQAFETGSKCLNSLSVKNFSESVKSYSAFNEKKRKVSRNNSVSRRENSPVVKEMKKIELKKRKIPLFGYVESIRLNDFNTKVRPSSARPSSPYVKKPSKDLTHKSLLKAYWKI